jgi:3-deoxy-D-manno-octulosonate 8-phosphate phosphatase (KDO 8-P phosphatase)
VEPASPLIPGELARAVRLVLLDVDGVLTDAGVYVGEVDGGSPIELKRFDIQDGLGIRLLRESGIRVALVSGRVSAATALRARELGLEECHQDGEARKLPVVQGLLTRHGLEWSQVAMLADDLPDLPVLRRVGLPAAVGNAVEEVRREAVWIGRRSGGRGAVREFAHALLGARGQWDRAVEAYVAARSGE